MLQLDTGSLKNSALKSGENEPIKKKVAAKLAGWLLIPILGLFYLFAKALALLIENYNNINGYWLLLTDSRSHFFVPNFAITFYSLQTSLLLLLGLLLWAFIAVCYKKRVAKVLFIFTMLLYALIFMLNKFIVPYHFGMAVDYANIIPMTNIGFYCAIWTLYFIFSQRVKNTFIN
nr:DUF2569 family protein [uncultured Moellerella sp.]